MVYTIVKQRPMRKIFTLFFALFISNLIYSQCSEPNETKVLLVGDSWAFFMGSDQTILKVLEKWGHSDYTYYTNITLSENGAETDDFLTQEKQDEIAAKLAEFPSIEVVHLSIGGNDVMGDWDVTFTQAEFDTLEADVFNRMEQVMTFIKNAKPGIKILWSGYAYPNFEEIIESSAPLQTSHPFYDTWEGMGFPSFQQINDLLIHFSATMEAYAANDPQVDFFSIPGLMQYSYGQPTPLGVAPGGTYAQYSVPLPNGNPAYPSPKESMRNYGIFKDCFHLSPDGYALLLDYHTRKYYHKLFMNDIYFLAENNTQTGSVSSAGNVSTELKMGESSGEKFATVLSFNTTAMADSNLSEASIFLRRESLTGSNPINGNFDVKVINGNFGTTVNVEAADYTANGDASGEPCRFGSNVGNGHWIRLDLPTNIFHYITNDAATQFIISTDATGGVVTFTNASDPEYAPVLDLKYGSNNFSVSENIIADVNVYPNPTSGLVTIDAKNQNIEIVDVLDLTGKTVMHIETKLNTIDITSLPAGTYVLNITTEQGKLSQKVVKL